MNSRTPLLNAASLTALLLLAGARTAPGLPNLAPYQPPGWSDKLIVSRTTGATSDSLGLTTNDMLYISWSVINNGNANAGANYTYFYVDGVQRGDLFSPSLNVNTYTNKRDFNLGELSAGTYTLTITADVTFAVTESNEGDNSYSKTITVGSLPNLAPYQPPGWSDKIIVARTVEATSDGAGLTTGDSLYVSWAVINNGNAKADANYSYLYVDGVQTGDLFITSLSPNTTITQRDFSIGKLSAGTHVFSVTNDATHVVTESNENDNAYSKSITIGRVPNLAPYQPPGWSDKIIVARTAGATSDSSGLTAADSLYISWAVINNGTTNAPANYSLLYVDGVQAGDLFIRSLNASTTITQRDFNIGKLTVGVHTLSVTNDATHVVAESNEDDNSYTRSVIIGALPIISVTPASQDFGPIPVGSTTNRDFTVQNTGTGTLSGSASVPTPFSIVSGSPYSLTANQSTTVAVRYSPTSAGSNSQLVSFSGGAGASGQVSGSSYPPPAIAITPSSLSFGSIQVGATSNRTFTVQNTGGGTLSGSASVSAPFSIVSGSPYSLTANQGTTVAVRYSPTSAGSNSQLVSFSGGAGASGQVSGSSYPPPAIAITPSSLDFGSIQAGATSNRTFTVQNTGGGTLSGSASVSAPFGIVSGSPYSLTANQSTNVTVRYSPTAAGNDSQSVSFSGGTGASGQVSGSSYPPPAISLAPSSLDFGSIQMGTTSNRTFTVQNTGGGTLLGSASVLAPFSIVSGSPYSLTANESADVTVRYSPTAVGNHSQSVSFSGGAVASGQVSGSSYPPPAISLTPSSLDFGSIQVGATSNRTFTVQNTGGGTLSGSASVSAPFSIVSGSPYSLTANQGTTVTVRYSPTSAGSNSQMASFSGGAGASGQVSGSSYSPPAISVAPTSQDYGAIQVGTASNRTFTVQNTGGGTLSGSASVSAPFSIVSGSPYSLTANQSTTLTVRYSPTSAGSNSQMVSFSGGGDASRRVSGLALSVPPLQMTGMALSNGVFRFVLTGPAGSNYVVHLSSNLLNWSPLSTNVIPSGGWVTITDPSTTNKPRRFYRALAP
ncbi:MAG TPA: choice-of-anchor D domain-containing protein [Candidatus Acidoferrum sp.]|nr:choice-of-anchor D domain-containing protein [Candidatus Acidoferrum sp.]